MTKLRVLDLFSGIGGFSLGLERTGGFETVAFCEIEEFPRRVLAKHWPEVPCYEDVTKLTGDILERDGIAVDVITGGFPCQDISTAGKQAGMGAETRSGLWSEIVRLIGELRPRYVIVENVANLLSGPSEKRGGWFGRVLGDLAECGYDAEWENIPAASVGAPHRRERVWIVAYPTQLQRDAGGEYRKSSERQISKSGKRGCKGALAHTNNAGLQGRQKTRDIESIRQGRKQFFERCADLPRTAWELEPAVGRSFDGFSAWMDGLDITEPHKLLLTYANETKNSPPKILRALRNDIQSEADQWKVGRPFGVHPQEVLLAYLCKLEDRTLDKGRISLEGEAASQVVVRGLRDGEKPSSPPHRSKLQKQLPKEHSDAMQALSRFLAQYAEKAWAEYRREDAAFALDWESGIARVANGVPSRVDRLKGLGNAVVPQIPELIGHAILAAEASA